MAALAALSFLSAETRASEPNADSAARAYELALSRYAAGDRVGALASMQESYRLSLRPELLYNLARLEQELAECDAALAHYREYLQRVPNGQYRTQAEQAVRETSDECPTAETAPQPGPELAPDATSQEATIDGVATPVAPVAGATLPPGSHANEAVIGTEPSSRAPARQANDMPASAPLWVGWSAIAAGGLAGIGAIYFTASALDARSRFQDSVDRAVRGEGGPDFSLEAEQHRDERWAQVLAVGSGALVASGVLVLALTGRPAAVNGVTTQVLLEPDGLSARVSSRF